ncbi:MAG: HAMP domain-containing sensor histidine kinase [Patescibacteria group bacterium]
MFQNTRLKLTMWYMLILMFVSVCFSTVIFRLMTQEVDRFARLQQTRIEKRVFQGAVTTPDGTSLTRVPIENPELVKEIKDRLLLILVVINVTIWCISSGLAYLLAGKTLRPIQLMVQEQHRFISDASHELKTPLTSLKTAFEVFSRDKNSTLPDAKQLITESIQEVNKLQSLSEHLLQLAQYQTPNGHARMEKISLDHLIREVVQTLQPLARKKKVKVDLELMKLNVAGYKFSLIDLMMILLDNAIKYSKNGGNITISLVRKDSHAIIKVVDQGMGIDKKDLPHIFDRFYRADSARSKTAENGYGLGLAIAKKIVQIHRGSLKVKSQVQKGTAFLVEIPVKN